MHSQVGLKMWPHHLWKWKYVCIYCIYYLYVDKIICVIRHWPTARELCFTPASVWCICSKSIQNTGKVYGYAVSLHVHPPSLSLTVDVFMVHFKVQAHCDCAVYLYNMCVYSIYVFFFCGSICSAVYRTTMYMVHVSGLSAPHRTRATVLTIWSCR